MSCHARALLKRMAPHWPSGCSPADTAATCSLGTVKTETGHVLQFRKPTILRFRHSALARWPKGESRAVHCFARCDAGACGQLQPLEGRASNQIKSQKHTGTRPGAHALVRSDEGITFRGLQCKRCVHGCAAVVLESISRHAWLMHRSHTAQQACGMSETDPKMSVYG